MAELKGTGRPWQEVVDEQRERALPNGRQVAEKLEDASDSAIRRYRRYLNGESDMPTIVLADIAEAFEVSDEVLAHWVRVLAQRRAEKLVG